MNGLLSQLGKVQRKNLNLAWWSVRRYVNIDAEMLPCELKEDVKPKRGPKKINLGRLGSLYGHLDGLAGHSNDRLKPF